MKFRRLFQLPWRSRRQIDLDAEDEIRFHLDSRVAELMAAGMAASDARARARREFGDLDDARAYIKSIDNRAESERRRSDTVSDFLNDLVYGVRKLVKAPSFSATVIVTLALGVGATTAIFSVVDSVLLRPMNFPQADKLARIAFTQRGGGDAATPPDLVDYRTQATSFDGFSIMEPATMNFVLPSDEPDRVVGVRVSANHFDLLRNPPLRGRFFAEGEDAQGAPEVAVISEALWRRRFAEDPAIVGSTIRINAQPTTVVGIARTGQHYPLTADIWTTRRFTPAELSDNFRGARWLALVARVKDDVPFATATAEVTRISEAMEARFPEVFRERRARAVDVQTFSFGQLSRPLYVMLGAVGLVLLIACANVANLMLVRGAAREGEMAIRTALGAGRGRLVRQLVAESFTLTTLGAGLGVGIAFLGMRAMLTLAPPNLLLVASQTIDGRALGLSALIALATAFAFGLLPAWQARRTHLVGALRAGGRGTSAGPAGNRVRRLIVAAEVALAVVLLSGAGLLLRSFQRLMQVDPGFSADRVLTARFQLPDQGYGEPERQRQFGAQLLEKLSAIPGAQQVALADNIPLDGGSFGFTFEVRGVTYARPSDQPQSELRRVTPGFFETLSIPVVRGRGLSVEDRSGAPPVLVVNEEFVRQNFPNQDAIGQAIRIGWGPPDAEPYREIVGVVADVRGDEIGAPPPSTVYLSQAQAPSPWMKVLVRSALPPATLTSAVRTAVRELDPTLPVFGVQTMEQLVTGSVARQRYFAVLIAVFASVALLLAAVGLYGVIAYGVSQRTHELGVRVALGATSGGVSGMIVREGLLVTALGLVAGLVAAAFSGGVVRSLLYEVTPADPVTYAGVAAVLALTAALASWLPARRAARVDPVIAMRGD